MDHPRLLPEDRVYLTIYLSVPRDHPRLLPEDGEYLRLLLVVAQEVPQLLMSKMPFYLG